MTAATLHHNEYLELVKQFPPRPIRSARDYDRTVAVMNQLAVRGEDDLSRAEADYLDALATFVERYDLDHIPAPEMGPPLQRLRHVIEHSGMSASDLGRLLGSRGLGSLLLAGKRELSKTHIRILADHFKLDPGYFL